MRAAHGEGDRRRRRWWRGFLPLRHGPSFSRFGVDVESPGVRPSRNSIGNIPQELTSWHKRSFSAQVDHSSSMPRSRITTTSGGALDALSGGGGNGIGGAHGAFTWGVLDALLQDGRLDLRGLITHQERAEHAGSAYQQAFTDAGCLKMVLDWRH